MWLIRLALRRPIAMAVLAVAILLVSGLSLTRSKIDILPDLNAPVIYVAQPYGGMSPQQIEGFVTYYYEYHFLYIDGIQTVEAKSIQGASLLRLTDLAVFPAFGGLVYGLAEAGKARGFRAGDAALAYLGRIAHAVYLVYLPVDILYFHGVERLVGQPAGAEAWAIWAGVFPVILLVGIAAHHLIQAPVATFLRRHPPHGAHLAAA